MPNHRDFESPEMLDAKQHYQSIAVPECLDDYIRYGLERGQKAKRQSHLRKLTLLAACVLLFSFVTSVRVSPAVATYVRQIPGLEHIVNLINYDKGLQSAIYNDFYQPLNLSDEHDGILFRVDGIIVDESSMVLFYTVETNHSQGQDKSIDIGEFNFMDESGKPLAAGFSYSSLLAYQDEENDGVFHDRVQIYFSEETVLPDRLKMVTHFALTPHPNHGNAVRVGEVSGVAEQSPEKNYLPATWEVTLPIDKTRFADMKKTYPLNQSLTVQGQTINFKQVIIYPTRIALEVEYDPQNSARIFGFDDLRFIDGHGEEWKRVTNGVSASRPSDHSEIIYFQSNYFTSPDQLYLVGSSIRMLPKEDCEVILDLEQERLLKSPPGLTLEGISPMGKGVRMVTLRIEADPQDQDHFIASFGFDFKDSTGQEYHMLSQGGHHGFSDEQISLEALLELPNHDYQGPLTFRIQDYPERVVQDFRFKVK